MKKALLVYSYSAKNAGDMAITLGAIDLLAKKYSSIRMLSRYTEREENFKESVKEILERKSDIEIIGSPFELDRSKNILHVWQSYLNGFKKLFTVDSYFVKAMADVDMVFFNGGNLLRGSNLSDIIRLIALMKPLRVAKRLEKPFIILSHSTAKTNFLARMILNPILNNAQRIYVREPRSLEKFKSSYPKAKFTLTTDLAFAIEEKIETKREKIVAITTRSHTMGDLGDFDDRKKKFIVQQLEECITFCIENDFKVLLVSQTRKDIPFTEILANKYNSEHVQHIINLETVELLNTYSKCSLIIGMRLHSIILALSTGTPAIGFFSKEWGLKNPGLMDAYNQKYCFIEDGTSILDLLKSHDFGQTKKIEEDILLTKNQLLTKLVIS